MSGMPLSACLGWFLGCWCGTCQGVGRMLKGRPVRGPEPRVRGKHSGLSVRGMTESCVRRFRECWCCQMIMGMGGIQGVPRMALRSTVMASRPCLMAVEM